MPALLKTPSEGSPDIFLASPPDHFRIVYAINDHMHEGMLEWKKNGPKIYKDIQAFWRAGAQEITKRGAQLIVIPADVNCPDQVFAADSSLTFIKEDGDIIALMSRMKYPERKAEVEHARKPLQEAGFTLIESDCIREGSGDTLFDPNTGMWFLGKGKRTAPGAGQQLSVLSERPVVEIPTIDEHFYHLDTFLTFLPKGHVMFYKDVMTPGAYEFLCSLYPVNKRLEINREAAMKFSTNIQMIAEDKNRSPLDHTLMISADCPQDVKQQLREWGYQLKPLKIRAARLAGGGIHCCFQRVCDLRRYPLRVSPGQLSNTNLLIWDRNGRLCAQKQPMKVLRLNAS